jgi:phage shock protein A
MGIFHRVTDIVQASLNDLIDRFEDPEALLRQAIREMEHSAAEALEVAASTIAAGKLMEKSRDRSAALADASQRAAIAAVDRGDDEAARSALLEKRRHARHRDDVESALAANQDSVRALRSQSELMRARLAEARRKLASLEARRQLANGAGRLRRLGGRSRRGLVRYAALRDRVEMEDAKRQVLAELAAESAGIEPEGDRSLDALAVEEELERLAAERGSRRGRTEPIVGEEGRCSRAAGFRLPGRGRRRSAGRPGGAGGRGHPPAPRGSETEQPPALDGGPGAGPP